MTPGKWPKVVPPLTPEQQRINDDFMEHWHQLLPRRYGRVEAFNHRYPLKHVPAGFRTTLEIGAGLGEHLAYELLTAKQERHYVALERRENMAAQIRQRFPQVQVLIGDCQARLDFPDGYFDRILAVHVLEHLPNLPAALREMRRLCHPAHGFCSVVIPCEGGLAYWFARRISAQRIFEQRYGQPYGWFIRREHLNRPREIFEETARYFEVQHRSFYPLKLPLVCCNLCIGLTLRPKQP